MPYRLVQWWRRVNGEEKETAKSKRNTGATGSVEAQLDRSNKLIWGDDDDYRWWLMRKRAAAAPGYALPVPVYIWLLRYTRGENVTRY